MDETVECDVCGGDHDTESCPELGLAEACELQFSRARLTVPSSCEVAALPNGSVCIVAKEPISKRTQFGPVEARRTTFDIECDELFVLKILSKDGRTVSLDTSDENVCNWMCLVHTAKTWEEQNCMAYQLGVNIFYNTTRDISPGDEIKVWYAPQYAKKLGKPAKPDGKIRVMLGETLTLQDDSSVNPELSQSFIPISPQVPLKESTSPEKPIQFTTASRNVVRTRLIQGGQPISSQDVGDKTENTVASNEGSLPQEECLDNNDATLHKFKCSRCSDTFSSQIELAKHLRDHIIPTKDKPKTVAPYHCKRCKVGFQNVSNYNRHMKKHKGFMINCPKCRYSNYRPDIFQSHLISKHGETVASARAIIVQHTVIPDETESASVKTEKGENHPQETSEDKLDNGITPRKRGRPRGKSKNKNDEDFVAPPKKTKIAEEQEVVSLTTSSQPSEFSPTRVQPKRSLKGRRTTGNLAEVDDIIIKKEKIDDSPSVEKGRRGRPPAVKSNLVEPAAAKPVGTEEPVVKRKRGRPRKVGMKKEVQLDAEVGGAGGDVEPKSESPEPGELIGEIELDSNDQTSKTSDTDKSQKPGDKEKASKSGKSSKSVAKVKDSEPENKNEASGDKDEATAVEKQDSFTKEKDECTKEKEQPETDKSDAVLEVGSGEKNGKDISEKVDDKMESTEVDEDGNKSTKGDADKSHNASQDKAVIESNKTVETETKDVETETKDVEMETKDVETETKDVSVGDSDAEDYNEEDDDDYDVATEDASDDDEEWNQNNGRGKHSKSRRRTKDPELEELEKLCTKVKTGSGEAYACGTCGKKFVQLKYLRLHLPRHTEKFHCEHCDKRFTRRETFNKHACGPKTAMTIQTKEEDGKTTYSCSECGKVFTKPEYAKRHFAMHTGSWKCDKCDKTFSRRHLLLDHVCVTESGPLDGAHECDICHQSFRTLKYLYRHMAMHTDIFKCEKCGKTFSRKDSMQRHILRCDPERAEEYDIHACPNCKKTFATKLGLENHVMNCANFSCSECRIAFFTQEDLSEHDCEGKAINDSTTVQFPCKECGKTFASLHYLHRHEASHQGAFACELCAKLFSRKEEQTYHYRFCWAQSMVEEHGEAACDLCSSKFKDPKLYREHYQDHTHPYKCEKCLKRFIKIGTLHTHNCSQGLASDDALLKCEVCQREFRNERYLLRHQVVHSKPEYQCEYCEKKFFRKDYLNDHVCKLPDGTSVRMVRKKNRIFIKENLICHLCGRSFVSVSNLNKHMKTHGERQNECDVCGKKFHYATYLKEHKKTVHQRLYQFQCSYCGKIVTSKTGLAAHIKQFHSDEIKLYQCPTCQKTFRQKGNLKTHMYSHSKEKNFQCEFCKKYFKYPDQLNRHRLEHTMVNKLQCDLCDKKFCRSYQLRKHVQTFHSGTVFVCELCNERCSHRHTIMRHYKRKHPEYGTIFEERPDYLQSLQKPADAVDIKPNICGVQHLETTVVTTDSGEVEHHYTVAEIQTDDDYLPQVAAEALQNLSNTIIASEAASGEHTLTIPSTIEGPDGQQTVVILQIVNPDDQETAIQEIQEVVQA